MWQTRGHKNQKLFLENALNNNKFSHAYLFAGPAQIGKRTLAIEFANKILGTENSSKFNPDLIILGKERFKIEDIRELINDLALKPYQYKYKIAIIDDFENVTEEAANSILKTLEEPNPTTIIILITKNIKSVLPTIVSRSQVVHFNRQQQELKNKKLSALVNGKIGKEIEIENDQDARAQASGLMLAFSKIKNNTIAERILAIKEYGEKEVEELNKIFENWLDQEHFEMISSRPQNYKNISLLCESLAGLKKNLNKKLILQRLFLNIS